MNEAYDRAVRRGQAHNATGRWREAVAAFKTAVDLTPTAPAAYAGLGEASLGLQRPDRALECYKLAARYSRGDRRYLNQVADLQERLGQLHEAGRTYLATAEIAFRQNALADAIANWQRAVQIEPNLLGAHRRLAVTYQRLGQLREAVREYLAIARILQARDRPAQALQMCQAALRLDPDNEDAYTAMRLIEYGAAAFPDEPEDAQVEAESDISAALRAMAEIFEMETTDWRVRQSASRSQNPVAQARSRAHETLAGELFRDEQPADRAATLKLSKLERDALIGQALDFERRGELALAVDCYARAMAGGLALPAAHFALGLLYIELGRLAEARRALETAVAQDPTYRQAAEMALAPTHIRKRDGS